MVYRNVHSSKWGYAQFVSEIIITQVISSNWNALSPNSSLCLLTMYMYLHFLKPEVIVGLAERMKNIGILVIYF